MKQVTVSLNPNRVDPRLCTVDDAKDAAESLVHLKQLSSDINVRESTYEELPVHAVGDKLALLIEFTAEPEPNNAPVKFTLLAAEVLNMLNARRDGFRWQFDFPKHNICRVEGSDQARKTKPEIVPAEQKPATSTVPATSPAIAGHPHKPTNSRDDPKEAKTKGKRH